MQLTELRDLTEGWATDRNFANGSDPLRQCKKLFEEIGESLFAEMLPDFGKTRDGLGDASVVLCIQAWQLHHDVLQLLRRGREVVRDEEVNGGITQMYGRICRAAQRVKDCLEDNDCDGALEAIAECLAWIEMRAQQISSSLVECWTEAWEQIKDRTGRMVDGVFVKDTD